jgi:hypothetical protein
MLNNLTNFFNLIVSKRIKTELESDDLIAVGTRQSKAVGDYKPTAIRYSELLTQLNSKIGGINIGPDVNIIYVSSNGDDANTGSVLDPVQTLEQGKNLANSGDLVYVLPGTYFFDNTLANGTPYNGFPEKVNLWKDGVSYYFELGAKVIIWNNTNQQNLSLFKPAGNVANEKVVVRGFLDFEFEQFGVSAGNGTGLFFDSLPIGTDLGYTFDAEINNITSVHQVFTINRVISTTEIANIRINFNRAVQNFKGLGSAASGAGLNIREGATSTGNMKITIEGNYLSSSHPTLGSGSTIFLLSLKSSTEVNINIKQLEQLSPAGGFLVHFQGNQTKNATVNFEQGYYNGSGITALQGTGEINVTGNLFPKLTISSNINVLRCYASGSDVINFTGNIVLPNSSASLAITEVAGQININANITYVNTSSAVSNFPVMRTNTGLIIFRGLIKGSLPLTLLYPRGGSIILNNAYIYNTQAVTSFRIMHNDTSTNSKVFINNSKIQINQNSGVNPLLFGNRIFLNLQNSQIVNNSNDVSIQKLYIASQTVANAKLFLLNSTLSSNDEAIDTTGEVVSVNSAARILTTPPVNLSGVITVEPNLPLE